MRPKYQVQLFRSLEDLYYGLNQAYKDGYEVFHILEGVLCGHREVSVVFQLREEVVATQ